MVSVYCRNTPHWHSYKNLELSTQRGRQIFTWYMHHYDRGAIASLLYVESPCRFVSLLFLFLYGLHWTFLHQVMLQCAFYIYINQNKYLNEICTGKFEISQFENLYRWIICLSVAMCEKERWVVGAYGVTLCSFT